jgi:hypothetical protein
MGPFGVPIWRPWGTPPYTPLALIPQYGRLAITEGSQRGYPEGPNGDMDGGLIEGWYSASLAVDPLHEFIRQDWNPSGSTPNRVPETTLIGTTSKAMV